MPVTVTTLQDPAPQTAAAEQKVEEVAPAAIKPEVAQVEADFNAAVDTARVESPSEKAQFEALAPEVGKVADDAAQIASGHVIPVTNVFSDAIKAAPAVKEGYKTTEFWLTIAGLALTNLSVIKIPGKYGQAITDAAAVSAYVLSRGIAKRGR